MRGICKPQTTWRIKLPCVSYCQFDRKNLNRPPMEKSPTKGMRLRSLTAGCNKFKSITGTAASVTGPPSTDRTDLESMKKTCLPLLN